MSWSAIQASVVWWLYRWNATHAIVYALAVALVAGAIGARVGEALVDRPRDGETVSGCCQICYKKAPTENQVQLEPSLSNLVGHQITNIC